MGLANVWAASVAAHVTYKFRPSTCSRNVGRLSPSRAVRTASQAQRPTLCPSSSGRATALLCFFSVWDSGWGAAAIGMCCSHGRGRERGRWWKQAVGRLRRGGASVGVWWSELVRGPCPGSPCRTPAGLAGPRNPHVTICVTELVLDSGANTWDCSPPPRVTSASLSKRSTRVDSGFTASWHFSGYVCKRLSIQSVTFSYLLMSVV